MSTTPVSPMVAGNPDRDVAEESRLFGFCRQLFRHVVSIRLFVFGLSSVQ